MKTVADEEEESKESEEIYGALQKVVEDVSGGAGEDVYQGMLVPISNVIHASIDSCTHTTLCISPCSPLRA